MTTNYELGFQAKIFSILRTHIPSSLNPGDMLVKRVRTGFPVRSMVPGTEHLADQIATYEVMAYAIDHIIAKTKHSLWELQSGELGTVESFRRDMEGALVDEYVGRIFTLLTTVWDGTVANTNYCDATATGVTQTILDNMIETVLARAGNVRSIVGPRHALLPVYAFAGIHEHVATGGVAPTNTTVTGVQTILEEWLRRGRVSTYKGIPLIELPQIFKRTQGNLETKLVPETSVLVIGDAAGEAILYGGTEFQDYTDFRVEPPDYTMAMWRGFGLIVDYPERVGRIKVAGTTPIYKIS